MKILLDAPLSTKSSVKQLYEVGPWSEAMEPATAVYYRQGSPHSMVL